MSSLHALIWPAAKNNCIPTSTIFLFTIIIFCFVFILCTFLPSPFSLWRADVRARQG